MELPWWQYLWYKSVLIINSHGLSGRIVRDIHSRFMKNRLLLLFAFILFCSCGKSEENPVTPPPGGESLTEQQKEGQALAETLWTTSPLQSQPLTEKRSGAFEQIQTLADKCSSTYFDNYLKSIDQTADNQ